MSQTDLLIQKRQLVASNDQNTGSYPIALTVTISSGTSLSDAADVGGRTVVGIIMPSAWDAADLSFEVSHDGTTFYDLQYDNAEVTENAAADQAISLLPAKLYPWRHVKVRSGTSATPVNQTANRELSLIVQPV